MAIDNAEKRKSVAAISQPYYTPSVTTNSGTDQEWRQQVAQSYSGILAGGAVVQEVKRYRTLLGVGR